MPLRLEEIPTKIVVMGIGDCGCNTINNLARAGVTVAKLVGVNSDVNALREVQAHANAQIGETTLKGRGSGGDIAKGRASAEEDIDRVMDAIKSPDLVVPLAGLGGGIGSGGTPYILSVIKESLPDTHILSVVTLPFRYEGAERMKNAQAGLREIVVNSDTTIINMNDMLLEKFGQAPLMESFRIMDDLLLKTVSGMVDMIDPRNAAIRIDFANFASIIGRAGAGFVGHGTKRNVRTAVHEALDSRLLDADPSTAEGVILYVKLPGTRSLADASEAPKIISEKFGVSRVSWGLKVGERERSPKVMVLAAGVRSPTITDMIGDVSTLMKE